MCTGCVHYGGLGKEFARHGKRVLSAKACQYPAIGLPFFVGLQNGTHNSFLLSF